MELAELAEELRMCILLVVGPLIFSHGMPTISPLSVPQSRSSLFLPTVCELPASAFATVTLVALLTYMPSSLFSLIVPPRSTTLPRYTRTPPLPFLRITQSTSSAEASSPQMSTPR